LRLNIRIFYQAVVIGCQIHLSQKYSRSCSFPPVEPLVLLNGDAKLARRRGAHSTLKAAENTVDEPDL